MRTIYLNNDVSDLHFCVATIGMFDGVHKGHQMLIGKVRQLSQEKGMPSVVITFDRSPRQVLDESFHPQLLTTLEEKQAVLATLGIDYLVVLPFTKEMAKLSAQTFMSEVLQKQLHVKLLVTGYDNRFGHPLKIILPGGTKRVEGFEDYVDYGRQLGMQVFRGDVEMMSDGQHAVSSSVIRKLLATEGRVELMPDCLTRYYQLRGSVMPGEHIGHQLGYPTANLNPDHADKLIPAAGVYAVWVTLEGEQQSRPAMMNIGVRPTFQGQTQTLEVNILNFEGNLYGQTVLVSFIKRLREERKFDSPEALAEQLRKDEDQVIHILLK